MAQQGEAAPGLRGCASERPTGFGGEGERGRVSHPSLTSVCFLFAVEREGDNPFIRNGWGVKEEDKHVKPASALPSCLFNTSVCIQEPKEFKHLFEVKK